MSDYDMQRDIDAEGQRAAIFRHEERTLVERLRVNANVAPGQAMSNPLRDLCGEAAQEIERLNKWADQARENAVLRRLLASAYGVTYGDDGELQNNKRQPFIDFKRDPVEVIEGKMVERLAREMTQWARENPEEAARLGVKVKTFDPDA